MADTPLDPAAVEREAVVRTYAVVVDGFDSQRFSATSAGKARMMAFRKFREVYPCDFRKFLSMSHVLHLGKDRPDDR